MALEELRRNWQSRLQADLPDQSLIAQESIIAWLLGENEQRLESFPADQLRVTEQAMDYRYRILQQRYLGVPQELAYKKLIERLSSLFLIRSKIRTWVALSRDRRRSVVDVLQEVIQEMIQSDKYIQQQLSWIARCTSTPRLRNALMLATLDEYCLRKIRNQPLLVYRFVNYLRRSQRGGMTQVPSSELIRLVSEEIGSDETDNPLSLYDAQAKAQYEAAQTWEEQQTLRNSVKERFADYLKEVDPRAPEWLRLYLQGLSQEAIAQQMGLPVTQIYRLREKIKYQAEKVFTLKVEYGLVTTWLGTSLQDHSLGLTPVQWQKFWDSCTPVQQQIIERLRQEQTFEAIALELKLKPHQVMSEWTKVYLAAQALRSDD